jgi:hypothetical protein
MVFCTCKAMKFVLAFALLMTSATVLSATSTSQAKKTVKSSSAGKSSGAKATTGSSKSAGSKSAAHGTTYQAPNNSRSRNKRAKASNASLRGGQHLQAAPSPERYGEIQKALATRGFYKGEVNGTWGSDSVEALKQFQTSQNLPNDGKISSLSLIGLGLGPAHAYPAGQVPGTATVSSPTVGSSKNPLPAAGSVPAGSQSLPTATSPTPSAPASSTQPPPPAKSH